MVESKQQPSSGGLLLELAACDDLPSFRRAVEADGLPVDAPSLWYGRWWSPERGTTAMGRELRTPLMVAALYGSVSVVTYILSTGAADVNRSCGSDSATALHCAAAGGTTSSLRVASLLVVAGAHVDLPDASGRKAADVVARQNHPSRRARATLGAVLRGGSVPDLELELPEPEESKEKEKEKKKEYPVDATLPDIKSGVYSTDEFRMYCFKVRPCSRAYTHDWTECPFVHPGENARRRDPRKYQYSCVPCPDFRKTGSCRNGDACEYAHGVFESWLHPSQYRTRLCKDEVGCNRRVCFFAHKPDELRTPTTVYPSPPGSMASSPRAATTLDLGAAAATTLDLGAAAAILLSQQQPLSPWLGHQTSRMKAADVDLEMLGLEEEVCGGGSVSSVMSSPVRPPPARQSPPRSQQQTLLTSALLNSSRASAFAKRSQSFIDRGAAAAAVAGGSCGSMFGGRAGLPASASPARSVANWGSPDGKLDWAIGGEELSKLRKSASFGFRSDGSRVGGGGVGVGAGVGGGPIHGVVIEEEPDVSWVQSLVSDAKGRNGRGEFAGATKFASCGDRQLYLEQERIFA